MAARPNLPAGAVVALPCGVPLLFCPELSMTEPASGVQLVSSMWSSSTRSASETAGPPSPTSEVVVSGALPSLGPASFEAVTASSVASTGPGAGVGASVDASLPTKA